MKIKGKNVFLSGPMTGYEHYNVSAFAEAHDIVKQAGSCRVFNPAINYLKDDKTYSRETYLRKCIEWLVSDDYMRHEDEEPKPQFDVMVQLPGWEFSMGAKLEATIADAVGIRRIELSDVE